MKIFDIIMLVLFVMGCYFGLSQDWAKGCFYILLAIFNMVAAIYKKRN